MHVTFKSKCKREISIFYNNGCLIAGMIDKKKEIHPANNLHKIPHNTQLLDYMAIKLEKFLVHKSSITIYIDHKNIQLSVKIYVDSFYNFEQLLLL